MRCPGCGRENRDDAVFCDGCGARVSGKCSQCGRELRPDAQFCDSCGTPLTQIRNSKSEIRNEGAVSDTHPSTLGTGHSTFDTRHPTPDTRPPPHLAQKILASRAALEGERKQVTVLFADVKGSMQLAEGMDPEEWADIMQRFFRILSEGVERFEGFVDKFTGDGIMALFGAPIGHEDHAQRACHAALHLRAELGRYAEELQRRRGLDFAVRMGLNSGEVVVGKIGDDLRMEYTAQGHTVGLAQRMEQIAAAGGVCLSDHTAKLVEGFFRLRDLGQVAVKGLQAPLRVWALEDVGDLRTRLDVSRARGFSRFVGRERELQQLEAALERTCEGNGQVVGIVGAAGTGKSRLCFEFVERCRGRGVAVEAVQCSPYSRRVPLLTFLDLLRSWLDVPPEATAEAARAQVERQLLRLDPQFEEVLPLVFEFLGLADPLRRAPAMDPEARRRRLFAFVRHLVHRSSDREPTILFLDDVHWIDADSDAFLTALAEAVGRTRTLLLVNFRPEYHAEWMRAAYYEQIPLLPLGTSSIRALLCDLLGNDPSMADLLDLVCERAGGNPFFAEEVVRSLVDEGGLSGVRGAYRLSKPLEGVHIPTTVQSLLAARLDRLTRQQKQVVQAAAVIGKSFSETTLERVTGMSEPELGACINYLRSGDFVYETSLYPGKEYVFAHPLMHEVAYQSQLASTRKRTHARVAEVLSEADGTGGNGSSDLIAHHWECAGENLLAAEAHARAARELGSTDPQRSFNHWVKVESLVRGLPESPETDKLERTASLQLLSSGWRQGLARGEAERLFRRGRQLIRRSERPDLEARLLASYGRVLSNTVSADAYLEHARQALGIACQLADEHLRTHMEAVLSQALRHAGRLLEGLELSQGALERARGNRAESATMLGFDPYLWLLTMRGQTLVLMGRLDEAQRDLDEVVRAATASDGIDLLVMPRWAYTDLCWARDDAQTAVHMAEEGNRIAEQFGSRIAVVMAQAALGLAHLLNRRPEEAGAVLEEALALTRSHQAGLELEAPILVRLAEARLQAGDVLAARDAGHLAADVARRRHARVLECQSELCLGRVSLRSHDKIRSEAYLTRALSLARETGAKVFEPLIRTELAELAELRGEQGASKRERQLAEHQFAEMGAYRRAAGLRTTAHPP